MRKYGSKELYTRIGSLFSKIPLCAVLEKEVPQGYLAHKKQPFPARTTIEI
jgi:hypothetical protein